MKTEREPQERQAMGDEIATDCGLATGKKWLAGRMVGTQESKAQHQQQKLTDCRQGQQTTTRPKQQPKMPMKGPNDPTDAETNI